MRFPAGCTTAEQKAQACYRAEAELIKEFNAAPDEAERISILGKQRIVSSLAPQYAEKAGKLVGDASEAQKDALLAFKVSAKKSGPVIDLTTVNPELDVAETRKNIIGGADILERG